MNQAGISIQNLPFPVASGRQRLLAAAFGRSTGEVIALRVDAALEGAVEASVLVNSLPMGQKAWPPATFLCQGMTLYSPPSAFVRPVLRETDSGFSVAWPLDLGGAILISKAGVVELALGRDDIVTAIGADRSHIVIATEPDPVRDASDIWFASVPGSEGAEWQPLGAGALPSKMPEIVTSLALFDGHVYAAKFNDRSGFELWRAPLDATSGTWSLVVPQGGWRYGASPTVTTMAVIGERLFVAAGGADRSELSLGDEFPEILAVERGGAWKLFCGQNRFTPEGLMMAEAPGGPARSMHAGQAIGGFEPRGEGIRIWLRPMDSGRDSVDLLEWSAGSSGWTSVRKVPVGELDVYSVANVDNGPCLVAAAFEVDSAEDPIGHSGLVLLSID